MTQDEFEARLRRVEDRLDIGELRARYCFAVDEGRWDDLVDLFTEDARVNMLGQAEGRDNLRTYFSEWVMGQVDHMWHYVHNEWVEIDGDRAYGQAMVEMPYIAGGEPYIVAAKYEDEFERVDGKWLFSSRATPFFYNAPYKDGWRPEHLAT